MRLQQFPLGGADFAGLGSIIWLLPAVTPAKRTCKIGTLLHCSTQVWGFLFFCFPANEPTSVFVQRVSEFCRKATKAAFRQKGTVSCLMVRSRWLPGGAASLLCLLPSVMNFACSQRSSLLSRYSCRSLSFGVSACMEMDSDGVSLETGCS